jgi:protein O-mannosyl-transferase
MTAIATSQPSPRMMRRTDLFWIAAVAAITLIAYLPIFNAGWIWDDNNYVTGNIHLHSLHGLRELWLRPGAVPQYYPLTHSTFWIEYHLWGRQPLGYHLDNLFLHIANAALIGLILQRLGVPGFMLAAALFALHPVQVESVAWVTERKNVLSTLFYLLALWQALDVWLIDPRSPVRGRKYLLCLGLFVLALLSKSVTSTLPAIVLLLIWWKRGRIRWSEVGSLIPFFVLGAAMGSITAWMEKHVVGAVGPEWDFTATQRIRIASHAVWFYLGKLIWPYPLCFNYQKWTISSTDWLYFLAILAVLTFLIIRRRRAELAALGFFVITLSPALGFVNVYPMRYSFVADHFQYLACAAPLALAAAILWRFKWFALAPLAILASLTFNDAFAYHDSRTLWSDVVAKNDQSFLGYYQLSKTPRLGSSFDEPTLQLVKSLRINPDFVDAQVALAPHYYEPQDWSRVEDLLRQAQLAHPESPLPMYQLGMIDRRRGRLTEAESDFAAAAVHLPDPSPAFEEIGEIELTRPDYPAAEAAFKKALSSNPDRTDTRNNLAALYLAEQNLDAAQAQSEAALEIDPDDALACNDLGIILAHRGQTDAAANYFRRALSINPSLTEARVNLHKLGRVFAN